MAIMIPEETDNDVFNESVGEARIYDALKCLPDDYYIFHSGHWSKRARSGRIKWGECDFLIYHPNHGILAVEVKSGGISCHNGDWYQTNQKTHETIKLKRPPMRQAEESKYAFIDYLSERITSYTSQLLIEPIVWFPSIDDRRIVDSMPNDYVSENVFLEDSLTHPEQAIKQAFRYYGMEHKLEPSPSDIKSVINIFAPNFEAVQSSIGATKEREYIFNRLTREQEYLLDYLEEQKIAAIQGAGGTGKTMLAIEKARRLSEEQGESVLFLCFNNMLLKHLRDSFKESMPMVSFHNLYSLCNEKAIYDHINESTILEFLNNFESHNWTYQSIIIDEGQDFSNEELNILNTIADLQNGSFYVFYDKNQLVQRFEENSWFNQVDCRLILNKNCRNTFEIANTAYSSLGLTNVKTKNSASGNKPKFHIVNNNPEAISCLSRIIEEYLSQGYRKNQITILSLKTEETSLLRSCSKIGKYNISTSQGSNEILFTTARKFKGLESDIVIVVDFDKNSFSSLEDKRLFYVATSRAKHYLDIVANIREEDLDKIVIDLDGELRKQTRMSLGLTLKVRVL